MNLETVPIGPTSVASVGEGLMATGKRSREDSQASVIQDVANGLRCSITTSLLVDPVATCDGHLYERAAIEKWFDSNHTSPNTGAELPSTHLLPLPAIRDAVERVVYSGCLASEDTREWLTRKALTLIDVDAPDEAQPLLERAVAEGDESAGFHLGMLLVKRAAKAKVPAAVAAVTKLKGSPWSIREKDTIRVLGPEALRVAVDNHNERVGYENERAIEMSESLLRACDGLFCVKQVDVSDDTIRVIRDGYYTSPYVLDLSFWIPVEACYLVSADQPQSAPADTIRSFFANRGSSSSSSARAAASAPPAAAAPSAASDIEEVN